MQNKAHNPHPADLHLEPHVAARVERDRQILAERYRNERNPYRAR